ncbi:hypothetical protein [Abyssalbus ytuae]|uniref:Uncharacterized protein n=1 Tax=Abyssalbus ytuae TaxID=2926907 RepID=A0A9E7D3I6_9FLAO|nr:hypothetical protein [Abyssalbus ytuae]UOB19358.1 hypothetical protein MQE35_08675 [Abyssalbus ytuae]
MKPSFLLILALFITSCVNTKFTNHDRGNYEYKKLTTPEKAIEVNVSAIPMPPKKKKESEKPKTFFDLRDSVPHKYLEVIGGKAKNTDEIIKAINTDLSIVQSPKKNNIIKDLHQNEITLRLLFSNIKKYYNYESLMHPNTRLEFLTTQINLENSNVYFYSIDKIENQFEEIDLGTLERNQSVSFNSKLTGNAGVSNSVEDSRSFSQISNPTYDYEDIQNAYDENGNLIGTIKNTNKYTKSNTSTKNNKKTSAQSLSASGEVAYANVESIKENLAIKYKKIKTGFSFTPNSFILSQRGSPLSDISENVVITATFKIKNEKLFLDTKRISAFSNLFKKDGSINKVDDITITEKRLQYSPCYISSEITLDIDYEGAIRAVKNDKKGRNSLEWDDNVIYYSFDKKNNQNQIIIPKSEFCHNLYKLKVTFKGDNKKYYLKRAGNPPEEILFYDDDDIRSFRLWFQKLIQSENISNLQSNKHNFVLYSTQDNQIPFSNSGITSAQYEKLKNIEQISFEIRKEN